MPSTHCIKKGNAMLSAEIVKLPVRDRMMLMEEIWDSISREAASVPSPEWHADVLAERKPRIQRGQTRLLTLDDLKNPGR